MPQAHAAVLGANLDEVLVVPTGLNYDSILPRARAPGLNSPAPAELRLTGEVLSLP